MKFFVKDINEVEEAQRALYKKVDGGYQLNVDISESPELKAVVANKNEILEEKRKLKEKLEAIETEAEKAKLEKETATAQTREEFERVLASERAQAQKEKDALQLLADKRYDQLKDSLLNSTVESLSAELAGADDAVVLKPHVSSRLDVEEVDGVLKLVVKDKTGNKSALTVEQLAAEMREDKTFASIVKGRDSGGGGSHNTGGNGGADFEKFFDPKNPEYSITKQAELEDKNPALYAELDKRFNTL